MSLQDRDPICAVDASSGLLVQTRHPRDWAGVRCSFGVVPGPSSSEGNKWFFEAEVTDEGLCRVGWTAGSGAKVGRNLGTDSSSWGFGGTGMKSHAGKFDAYGASFKLADCIGCALEFLPSGSAEISYTKNGAALGPAFLVPAAAFAGTKGMWPTVVLKNAEMRFNFGSDLSAAPFKFPPPQGFRPIAAADAEQKVSAAAAAEATPAPAAAAPAVAAAAAASQSAPSKAASKAASSSSSSSSSSAAAASSASSTSPFAIIFEPTRELALQVVEELAKFTVHLEAPKIRSECFVGGGGPASATSASALKGLHIVVGTPARIGEMVRSNKLDVSDSRCLVLDEADQLVGDSATKREILSVYERMPKHSRGVQIVICSATLHSLDIQLLAKEVTVNPTWVDLKGKDAIPDSVDHVVIVADPRVEDGWRAKNNVKGLVTDGVHAGLNLRAPASAAGAAGAAAGEEDPDVLSEGLKRLKPSLLLSVIDQFLMEQCMIFARTQLDCDNIETFLLAVGGGSGKVGAGREGGFKPKDSGKENPYSCCVLHGGRSAAERARNLAAFKSGEVRFLICTDVAARGIDVAKLPYVINLTLPDKAETYIHRVGRVGRADAVGLAISIVAAPDTPEKVWWHTCGAKGGKCANTRLTDQGGCTVLFDEADMLAQIEARLGGMSIPALDRSNLALGAKHVTTLASKAARRLPDDGTLVAGQHINVLRPTVAELARLEVTAQCTFWSVATSSKWAEQLKAK